MPETLKFQCPKCHQMVEVDPKRYAHFMLAVLKHFKLSRKHGAVYHLMMFLIDFIGEEELDKILLGK